jgi:hypothetical protein
VQNAWTNSPASNQAFSELALVGGGLQADLEALFHPVTFGCALIEHGRGQYLEIIDSTDVDVHAGDSLYGW